MPLFIFFLVWCFTLNAIELSVHTETINVNGKEATVYAITQPNGEYGLTLKKGDRFDVTVKDNLDVPTSVHWHGLILPNNQDGVAFITQFPIYPKETYPYSFPLVQTGTFWMHAHYGLQDQQQLIAPLIIYAPEDAQIADQEVVMLLSDFSFKSPSEIYQKLRTQNLGLKMNMKKPDLVEVDYDAFLMNVKTSQTVTVQPNSKVRLRIIDGGAATNFFVSTGNLAGQLIAVDGNRIQPIAGNQFEIAVAQRLDIVVTIPGEGSFPIIAQGEGTSLQTGLILATPEAKKIAKIPQRAKSKAGGLTNVQEKNLHALTPLIKKRVDKQAVLELGGNMEDYVWTINGQAWPESTPVTVEKGQRVELVFTNKTSMSHPMHLHGHVFQVTEIDGQKLDGALRDTILVMPNQRIAVQFDADNPGVWPLHCHIAYHLEAGMFTVLKY